MISGKQQPIKHSHVMDDWKVIQTGNWYDKFFVLESR